ncbi:MAG TPA: alpha-mannosidase, partial [Opitutaceae bacterium]|nr:alpha-mannosidase [Opitutaceae bacterium]
MNTPRHPASFPSRPGRGPDLSRREFLVAGAAAMGALAVPALRAGPTPDHRRLLRIIGHSHVDAAWLWPWRDSANLVLTTFRSALDRMQETPDFRYSHSSAMHYRWAQRADPAMFEEIRARVREGRWEVVGGWPVEPDCNLPSTESFVRHCLYGKRFCEDVLGVSVNIGFNPDSFGHAAGLPSLLKQAGYDYYVFMRPGENEADLPLLFWWEGPDGARVLALRIYRSYNASAADLLRRDIVDHEFAAGFQEGAFFLGVGDHGGGVTKEQIRQVLALKASGKGPDLRWSTLREFFQAVEQAPAMATLPVIKGELQHHSRGCYSANGAVKILNRRAERMLGKAETILVAAGLAASHAYPKEP